MKFATSINSSFYKWFLYSVQEHFTHSSCCSVAQLCLTLCDPMDCSMLGFPVLHHLPELAHTHVHWVCDAIQPSHPLVPFSSCHQASRSFLMFINHQAPVFPSIKVFSNESALHIRWPKYWSFSFSISPSDECSGLISFRIDWFDLFAVKGLSKVFSSPTVWKHLFFGRDLIVYKKVWVEHPSYRNPLI